MPVCVIALPCVVTVCCCELDDRATSASSQHTVQLGPTLDRGTHVYTAELGHRVQAMGARIQGAVLLWFCQGAQSEATGVCLSCVCVPFPVRFFLVAACHFVGIQRPV